jgi:hypothetical protein
MRPALLLSGLSLLAATPSALAQHVPGTPSLALGGEPCLGRNVRFELGADPGTFALLWLSASQGPTIGLPIGLPFVQVLGGLVPPSGQRFAASIAVPNDPALLRQAVYHLAVGFDPAQPQRGLLEGPSGVQTLCGPPTRIGDLVLVDSDVIDSGISTIEAAASRLGVAPDVLVNDNNPVELGNPWLPWSTLGAGDIVTLPAGSVGDEGLFALPAQTPFTFEAFLAGTVPQPQLDNIRNVMPLGNQELARLIGRTLVAVVKDGDYGLNYNPLQANLQGARNGLLAFTVLGVQVPGRISESGNSNALYDLRVRIEGPITSARSLQVPVVDLASDSLQITTARMQGNLLIVEATANSAPTGMLSFSVEGFTFESPMSFVPGSGSYRASLWTPISLAGRRVTVSSDQRGAYTDTIQ